MDRLCRLCLALAGMLLLLPSARAVDPALDWRTLTTAHFEVHFAAGQERLAREAAGRAEAIHDRLSSDLGWLPGSRTQLVLTDESDLANGWATPFPFNRSQLYLVPPDAVDGLEDYGDWLSLLIAHEYTHVLHLDKAEGVPWALRYGLGRHPLLFPNVFQPTWMTEGIATWVETDVARGTGRGQSAYYEMLMRMEVVDGIKPFDQVSMSGIRSWPAGTVPYLYGVHFFQFLERRFGRGAIRQLVEEYSDNLIPFLLQSNFRSVLGWDSPTLWPAFERYLWTRYDPQIAAARSTGIRTGERITEHGYRTDAPRVGADGRLYYLRSDSLQRPAIVVREPDGHTRELVEVHPYARLAVPHEAAGLLLVQPELCESRYLYYDLYRVDPDTGGTRRLTHCGRYHFAQWAPDGTRIAAVRIAADRSELVMLDDEGEALETLWRGAPGVVLSHLTWTPDGHHLIAALFRPGSGWDLERFDLKTRQWRAITDDPIIETEPVVGPEGRYLYYSSAHGGIYNLRRRNLRTGETVTLTNVLGGAFAPAPAADGSLYYRGYTAGGFDIFHLRNPLQAGVPASNAPPLPAPESASGNAGDAPVTDYNPWGSLLPRWWMPTLYATEDVLQLGGYTTGQDALGVHQYLLAADYEFEHELLGGGFSYAYDGRYRLSLQRWHSFDYADDDLDELESIRRHDQAELVASFPLVRLDYLLAAHLGIGWSWEEDVERPAGGPAERPEEDGILGLAVTWDDTVSPSRAISPLDGRTLRVAAETSEALESDFSGEVYSLDWQEFIGLWGKHVLALRIAGGWGTEWPRPFELGGSAPAQEGPLGSSFLFNRRAYPLRGYPTGLAELTGRRMQLGSAEWRFPIATVERAITTPFVGVHRLHGRVFADTGAAWTFGNEPDGYQTGAGTELYADLNALYIINLRVGLGYAYGFDEGGEHRVYLSLATPLF
ncbi:hypothetical protein H0Z60_08305 [Ectothiorhodospiraceae bacterium WFHF3C12]|nr:hypothetical protein [Ectothiorhodospiraceae bacterium WFHF3C12]